MRPHSVYLTRMNCINFVIEMNATVLRHILSLQHTKCFYPLQDLSWDLPGNILMLKHGTILNPFH